MLLAGFRVIDRQRNPEGQKQVENSTLNKLKVEILPG
jgi:hypothetical protein